MPLETWEKNTRQKVEIRSGAVGVYVTWPKGIKALNT